MKRLIKLVNMIMEYEQFENKKLKLEQKKVDTYQAIVINYFVCVLVGSLLMGELPIQSGFWQADWFPYSLVLGALFISALNKENLDEFRKRVYDEVRDIHVTRFPYNNFLYPEHLDQY